MKKFIAFIGITLSLAVVFSTAFVAYAKPPRKALIYGSIFGVSDDNVVYDAKIVPVSNNRFGVYSDTALDTCTRVYLYFRFDEEIQSSFHIKLRLLSTQFTYGSQNVGFTRLCNISDNGSTSDFQSVGSNTQISVSGTDITWDYIGTYTGRSAFQIVVVFNTFAIQTSPMYFEVLELSVNGNDTALTYTDQQLEHMWNYQSQGGSSDTAGAESLVESISGDVDNINNTIQQHTPNVQNWFNTSTVSGDLMNIALLANSWLTAYLYVDPDVAFYWSLVTFCILLTLIENGLRRRPWHGFDDGEFNTEYDVESTDSRGRTRVIHNKVTGRRVR